MSEILRCPKEDSLLLNFTLWASCLPCVVACAVACGAALCLGTLSGSALPDLAL